MNKINFLRINLNKNQIKRNINNKKEIIIPQKYLDKLYIDKNHYSYSSTSKYPSLYSLTFSLCLRNLLGINEENKSEVINYLNSFQDKKDSLYKDEELNNENVNYDWWGWRHLSALIITAIVTLDGKTKSPFRFVDFLYGKGNTRKWLESLNWTSDCANTSNTVMNYGTCLQYNRDFWGISEANNSILEMFDFLDEIQDKETGLWGSPIKSNQNELSLMEQTAYHLWILYFYDIRKIEYIEYAIDSCLALQNEFGGFGPGHNIGRASNPFTSACEDIDCIDPLSRFYFITNYRKSDIEESLRKAIPWILYNQNKDGGFVFRREEKLVYGHQLMMSERNHSNIFATWFRTLSLAYISMVLPNESIFNDIKLNLNDSCPGYQFWKK